MPAVSIRSLTRSRLPDSGPGRGSAGASTHVITALSSSARDNGDGLDLDLRARDREAGHLDERARRPRVAEDLLPYRIDPRAVVDVGEEDGDLRHVREGAAGRREHRADVRERLPRLGDDVVASDE